MKFAIMIFTISLATGCAKFDRDLGELGDEIGTETDRGTDGDPSTSTSGHDMDETDTGNETGEMDETGTGETGFCGDGIANEDEQCDGDDLKGETCETQEPPFPGGTLLCRPDCTINKSHCGWCPDDFECPNPMTCVAGICV